MLPDSNPLVLLEVLIRAGLSLTALVSAREREETPPPQEPEQPGKVPAGSLVLTALLLPLEVPDWCSQSWVLDAQLLP